MRSFVAWHGQVPPDAVRVDDAAARSHGASWVRRAVGKGMVASYVIGYEATGGRWWTFFFEREPSEVAGWEAWAVEAYAHDRTSWAQAYLYIPREDRWLSEAKQRIVSSRGER